MDAARLHAENFVHIDPRHVGWEPTDSRTVFEGTYRSAIELVPDLRHEVVEVLASNRGAGRVDGGMRPMAAAR